MVRYKRELLEPYPWGLGRKGPIHERKFVHVENEGHLQKPELVLIEQPAIKNSSQETVVVAS